MKLFFLLFVSLTFISALNIPSARMSRQSLLDDVEHHFGNAHCPPSRNRGFSHDFWAQKGGLVGESLGTWNGTGKLFVFDSTTFDLVQTDNITDFWNISIADNGTLVWLDYFHTSLTPTGYDILLTFLISDEHTDEVRTCTQAFSRADAHGADNDFELDLPYAQNIRTTLTNFPDGDAGITCFYKYGRKQNNSGKLENVVVDCNVYPRILGGSPSFPFYASYHLVMERN